MSESLPIHDDALPLPLRVPDDIPTRLGREIPIGGMPQMIPLDGSPLTFEVPLPPIPCARCGRDLRGESATLVNPRPTTWSDGGPATAYDAACAPACPGQENASCG